ncbi:DUF5060 domain-containing protein [Rhizomicrobium electricum]|nr:DUF5060 domain-containing protein [Rhizomicrobium electricum]NIJ50466.1 hypothetical protein [Rhizomicrobium electricum]
MKRMLCALAVLALALASPAQASLKRGEAHVWDTQEIVLAAAKDYANPYADVTVWIDLKGPGFDKRVYGFWDGGRTWRVRFVATAPGDWTWTAHSDHPDDAGLNNGNGALKAVAWNADEIKANPNRRGFIRATANGHALQYADGTPFFIVGDTWLAASTWRLPMTGADPRSAYAPGPGISFEQAIGYRQRQGFNSISFIAAFPNWASDAHGATYDDAKGVGIRNAWEKFGVWAPGAKISTGDGATTTAKNMEDEAGNVAFPLLKPEDWLSDFDRINPAYFRSLDRKMRFLADNGFAPMFEPVRRDTGPSWKAYFDFNKSYARFVGYLQARYGAYNLLFSGIHLDWLTPRYGLSGAEYNGALEQWRQTYGVMPFGQPVTALIDTSTYRVFGDPKWLTMHTAGNRPRDHGIYPMMEESFRLSPAKPLANMEPYYTGWDHTMNSPAGERPEPDSDRDIYFARAMMYGSVLSGGLAGHVHGTAAYDLTSTGEPAGWRPYIWDALNYRSAGYMAHLRDFVLSEGARYQDLTLATDALSPRASTKAVADGLDGWSFLMRTPDKTFALAYFERKAAAPKIAGMKPGARYRWVWFEPQTGGWSKAITLTADANGVLQTPALPSKDDWAAKILAAK